MLTAAAYFHRKWGRFPRLAALLAEKALYPTGPWTSIDDPDAERTARLQDIVNRIDAYWPEVEQAFDDPEDGARTELQAELAAVRAELEGAARWHEHAAADLRARADALRRRRW